MADLRRRCPGEMWCCQKIRIDPVAGAAIDIKNPVPGRPMLPVAAGSAEIARTTLPPKRWRCSPMPIHRKEGPVP